MLNRIDLKLGPRSYGIFVQDKILSKSASLIHSATKSRKFAILSVKTVYDLYGKIIEKNLNNKTMVCQAILIPDGESSKNQKTLFYILDKMSKFGFQRDSCLICLGGGVIGDLGGLAASLYMRGIDYIQCPTTLLAQVDASIGGKTAVDYKGIKNLIGSFHQPRMVLVDPVVLKSLNHRQFITGLAEVIKYGVIGDEKLFEKIENNLPAILRRETKIINSIINRSCQMKAKIVSSDERESGKRAILNYGHTMGHALESYFRYKVLTHGEAVAYGMWFASILSRKMGLCSNTVLDRQRALLRRAGLFPKLPRFEAKVLLKKMFLDKKARNGQILFVLTRKIGLVTIQKNIPQQFILSALNQLQAEASEF